MRHKLFINDEWVEPVKGEYFATIDPATEEPIAEVARATAADIDKAVKAANAAMNGPWSRLSPTERGALMFKLADAIAGQRDELARLETLDVGKPLRDSLGDVDGVVNTLRYNAGAADKMQGETIPLGPDVVDFTLLEPMGVTAHIVPWNFPLGMAMRSMGDRRDHGPFIAAAAAFTALSTSAGVARAISAMGSSVAGSMVAKYSPLAGSTHSSLMKSLWRMTAPPDGKKLRGRD